MRQTLLWLQPSRVATAVVLSPDRSRSCRSSRPSLRCRTVGDFNRYALSLRALHDARTLLERHL